MTPEQKAAALAEVAELKAEVIRLLERIDRHYRDGIRRPDNYGRLSAKLLRLVKAEQLLERTETTD